jgi:poly(A) polymerase
MDSRLDPHRHSWMTAADTGRVIAALSASGEARFVGGAVRNALLGEPVQDIDIATTLPPDGAAEALRKAGIQVVPTGLEHGTLTAVVDGRPFEVTTLRRDVSTDGRRATVAFTTDWALDAGRRDFTMNAIYADLEGRLYDPTGGIADLGVGRVRFVGDPQQRVREDYLRILRLFRFHAWYGREQLDEAALAAARDNRDGLRRLSGERIRKEILRLLEAPDPVPTLRAMEQCGVLDEILPPPSNIVRLRNLRRIGLSRDEAPAAVIALAALLPSVEDARALATRLKLSNAERDRLVRALTPDAGVSADLDPAGARRLLYRLGRDVFLDMLALRQAEDGDGGWATMRDLALHWQRPEFPVDGADIKALGIAEGPQIGRLLAALERIWVEEDFEPGRDALLARLESLTRR